jgi:2-oxoglutarate dehydrogenase E2 component (dihydrolipoamide succinyltransferase)
MIDVVVPLEQEGTKAVVRAWLKQVGDRVEVNDPLVELETDKVTMEVPAPSAGVLREILLDSGADAVPGAVLGRIATSASVDGSTNPPAHVEQSRGPTFRGNVGPSSEAETSDGRSPARRPDMGPELRLSPAVKRACLQHNIDPTTIAGTGRDGRVTRADIDQAVQQARRTPPTPKAASAPPTDGSIRSHSVPHDRMRPSVSGACGGLAAPPGQYRRG